jgi:excinuclease ABC subunit C
MAMDELKTLSLEKDSYKDLPTEPGVYLFKKQDEESEKVLYVGKAKNLRSRVRQYFQGDGDGRAFVQFIRNQTNNIDFVVMASEQDAVILENDLIKKYKPPYNIHLKDDKRHLSIRIDLKHEWPRVEVVRRIKKDGALYLGPYSSASRLRESLNLMQKLFPLRSCPDKKLYNRSRPCIEYDIKRCAAPCVGYVSPADYKILVDEALMFLKGENEELLQDLEENMNAAAEKEAYEEAAKFRDRIQAIEETTLNQQAVVGHKQLQKGLDQDAIGISRTDTTAMISIIFVRNGSFWDQKTYEFSNIKVDDQELLRQFIDQYYSSGVYLPHELLMDEEINTEDLSFEIKIIQPRSKEKRAFLDLAKKNAEFKLNSKIERSEKMSAVVDKIQAKLKLRERPTSMDCIDISHHQGSEVVASVVRFHEGLPQKDYYRKIKLHADKVDDFDSIREAIERRYKTEQDLPDLIVIDGGKGQLNAAYEILCSRRFDQVVELCSLAKARDKEGEIDPFNPQNRERVFKLNRKNPILLEKESAEELLLSYLRDEAHRFAITYHRQRKAKALATSILDSIPGMTAKNKLKLLKHFGSVDAIKEAQDVELLKLISANLLESLRYQFEQMEGSGES